ncbi:MAG TPA: helix-turn-helix transcriptional regulator [Puia sp.]|nr:helix-turn-helix transcriptional regulator [Puia sp.]
MIRYSFQLKDFRNWLNGFGRLLGAPVIDGRIDIPPNLGEGWLFASNIRSGISYVVMNFSLKEDLVLQRKISTPVGLSLFFNQVNVNDLFSIREPLNFISDKAPHRSNVFLSSTGYELEVSWSRDSRLKRVGIFFEPAFINKAIKKNILRDLLLYTDNRLQNINKEPIGFEYRQILNDLFHSDRNSAVHHLVLHNRVMLLTEKFLHSFLNRTPIPITSVQKATKEIDKDLAALKDVERMLRDTRTNKFPSIERLSHTAMMSPTNLKAKFKKVYGMKLYEFFNRNRLEKAKEMLKTGEYSVKQVGVAIGFSNLSNFAKAFKKEFGILPKEINRT